MPKGALPNGYQGSLTDKDNAYDKKETGAADKRSISSDSVDETQIEKITDEATELRQRLSKFYDQVLVVDSISAARQIVSMLTNEYKYLIHACDTKACIGLNFIHVF